MLPSVMIASHVVLLCSMAAANNQSAQLQNSRHPSAQLHLRQQLQVQDPVRHSIPAARRWPSLLVQDGTLSTASAEVQSMQQLQDQPSMP